jgi:hypothetical protein
MSYIGLILESLIECSWIYVYVLILRAIRHMPANICDDGLINKIIIDEGSENKVLTRT